MPEEITYTNITHMPEIVKLAIEVQATRKKHVLCIDGQDIAIVQPISAKGTSEVESEKTIDRSGKQVLLKLLSMGVTGGPEDLSANIDHYLYGGPKKAL
jgi:hypothetical protein